MHVYLVHQSIQPSYLSSALADYYLLSIENIQLLSYLYLCLNWISVFFRSHTGNWSLLNEDCYSAQINGVQTKSTLRVSVTSDIYITAKFRVSTICKTLEILKGPSRFIIFKKKHVLGKLVSDYLPLSQKAKNFYFAKSR